MKTKIFSFILLTALLITSCTPNNPQPNPPPNPTNSNWKFKLTINGNTTHAEGSGYNQSSNFCIAFGGTGPAYNVFEVDMKLNDLTAASYISGELGFGYVASSYTVLGVQNIYNCWIGSFPWITNVLPEVALGAGGYALTLNGTMVPNSDNAGGVLKLPINITDLGSPGNNDMITFGNPLKGNYSGTIYVRSGLTGVSYDTPVTIDLDFVALRP